MHGIIASSELAEQFPAISSDYLVVGGYSLGYYSGLEVLISWVLTHPTPGPVLLLYKYKRWCYPCMDFPSLLHKLLEKSITQPKMSLGRTVTL